MRCESSRQPTDMNAEERNHVIDDTLDALDLTHRRHVNFAMLSGGQRKRVSVGVELLSRPGVIFLDEPTSGLDPGTESKLMKLFRRLADQGRTVVCTTHVMENIDLFHKIVVLAPGGRLAYFGPPQEAKAFFGIDKIYGLYDRMEEQTPEDWQVQYRQSPQFAEQVAPVEKRFANEEPGALRHPARRVELGSESHGLVYGLRQCWTLVDRLARLQWVDRTTLGVMLAQPLIITALICAVCRELPTIDFLLVVSALATRACEVSMLGGKTINIDLIKEAHLHPLWNLYPSDPLNTTAGRVKFLEQHHDMRVENQGESSPGGADHIEHVSSIEIAPPGLNSFATT